MKPKKTFSAYLLLLGVMSLAIVGGILAFQIFSASTKNQLSEKQRAVIKPIDGTINQTTIDNLEKRTIITEDEINIAETMAIVVAPISFTSTPTLTPTVTTFSQVASPAAVTTTLQ